MKYSVLYETTQLTPEYQFDKLSFEVRSFFIIHIHLLVFSELIFWRAINYLAWQLSYFLFFFSKRGSWIYFIYTYVNFLGNVFLDGAS